MNNAAVSFNEINENSVEHAETVIKTNFYGAKLLTEALLPMFRHSPSKSRILNISSRLGSLNVSENALHTCLISDVNQTTSNRKCQLINGSSHTHRYICKSIIFSLSKILDINAYAEAEKP